MLCTAAGCGVDDDPAWLLPVGTVREAVGDETDREPEEPDGNATVSTMPMTTATTAPAPASTHRLRERR
jgi:hypothetical protein